MGVVSCLWGWVVPCFDCFALFFACFLIDLMQLCFVESRIIDERRKGKRIYPSSRSTKIILVFWNNKQGSRGTVFFQSSIFIYDVVFARNNRSYRLILWQGPNPPCTDTTNIILSKLLQQNYWARKPVRIATNSPNTPPIPKTNTTEPQRCIRLFGNKNYNKHSSVRP